MRRSRENFLSFGDRTLHALLFRREDEFGPKEREHLATLDGHTVRHRENKFIAFGCGDERKCNSGIAGGRLDQDGFTRSYFSIRFGGSDHGETNAVFDRGQRIEEFQFENEITDKFFISYDARHAHQRRRADCIEHRVIDASAKFRLGHGCLLP